MVKLQCFLQTLLRIVRMIVILMGVIHIFVTLLLVPQLGVIQIIVILMHIPLPNAIQ